MSFFRVVGYPPNWGKQPKVYIQIDLYYSGLILQVDEEQMTKILSLIDSGKSEGAKMCTGGAREGDKGFYVQPTVFADVKDHMRIAKEEVCMQMVFVVFCKDHVVIKL